MLKKVSFFILLITMTLSIKSIALADSTPFLLRTMDSVDFRTGASLEDELIITLDFGVLVQVLAYDKDGWSQIKYNDIVGYVKSEYIGTENMLMGIEEALPEEKNIVELLQWSEVKNIFTIGVPAEVYDVYTGITYYVKSFSNGLHADVETVTKEDTALMKKTFNDVWSWDVRPVFVTINGRTIAGSINGMPHGGGVNNSNGMNGQVCIHFLGSTTHNGNKSFAKLHQDVLHKAYELSK